MRSRLVALVLLAPVAAAQATIDVPADSPTIQGAIVLAADGDTVRVAPGRYVERLDFLGKAITVESSHGAAATTIDGAFTGGSVVTFQTREDEGSVLRGFTVTGGATYGDGGGIRCAAGATPRIEACTIRGNFAGFGSGLEGGGGISGDPVVEDSLIESNEAYIFGGGLRGAPTLRRCVVRGNRASRGGGLEVPAGGSARLEDCTLEGNRSFSINGIGGAVLGDAVLEDCAVVDNLGIALFGSFLLRRCSVRGNVAYDSAALYLLGGAAEDCEFVENRSADGSNGGTVTLAAPGVSLTRCVIARNVQDTFGTYATRGVGVQVRPGVPEPHPRIVSCTIVGNRVVLPAPYGGDVGGVFGPAVLVNTIVRDNDHAEYDPYHRFVATHSNVEGGFAGTGNFDLDPLFVDAAAGDYRLAPGSPCIDAGTGPLEEDCSPPDVGAFPFVQDAPSVTVRNGTGVNPAILAGLGPPLLGASWTARLSTSAVPGATVAGVLAHAAALDPGLPTAAGELLIRGPRLQRVFRPSAGTDDFTFPIPDDAALLCAVLHLQGVAAGPGFLRFTNALAVAPGR